MRASFPRGRCPMATNLLISSLPAAEQSRLKPFFERVNMADGEELVRAGQSIGFIWFIENGVIVTSQPLRNRMHVPAGIAGSEGVAGFELWLGRNISPLSTVAEVGGDAIRMTAQNLQREVLGRHSPLNQALGDYVFDFVTIGAQMAVCLQSHPPEERLCRWLQMIQLRAPGRDRFPLSEPLLATLLNTEPHTALLSMRVLEQAGLIEYRDHHVRVLDKQGLQDGCCECLSRFQERFSRLQTAPGNSPAQA
jgi:CRP-like cAMP-binding protein